MNQARDPDGRFALGARRSPTLTLERPPVTPPPGVAAIMACLLDLAGDLEFPDHSGECVDGDDEPSEWARLDQMQDPEVAANNCYAATHRLLDAIADEIGLDPGQQLETVEVVSDLGDCHWANVVIDGSDRWVVDFTARQFDAGVPFPLVLPLEDWQARVDGWLGAGETTLHADGGQALARRTSIGS